MKSKCPVRVDFAGGWLDVPALAKKDGYIVNCSVAPCVTKECWPYERQSGLGGSAAWAILEGKDPFEFDSTSGAGWQDPAVILETGLCVWESGPRPELVMKVNPFPLLGGRMALLHTGSTHNTADILGKDRWYEMILAASLLAKGAVIHNNADLLSKSIILSYTAQLQEGMAKLPECSGAVCKYCGSGWGGYALYYFETPGLRYDWIKSTPNSCVIEPYFNYRWEE